MEQQKDQVHLAVPGGEAKSVRPSLHSPARCEGETFEHYKYRRADSRDAVRRITHPVNLGGPRDFWLHTNPKRNEERQVMRGANVKTRKALRRHALGRYHKGDVARLGRWADRHEGESA